MVEAVKLLAAFGISILIIVLICFLGWAIEVTKGAFLLMMLVLALTAFIYVAL